MLSDPTASSEVATIHAPTRERSELNGQGLDRRESEALRNFLANNLFYFNTLGVIIESLKIEKAVNNPTNFHYC